MLTLKLGGIVQHFRQDHRVSAQALLLWTVKTPKLESKGLHSELLAWTYHVYFMSARRRNRPPVLTSIRNKGIGKNGLMKRRGKNSGGASAWAAPEPTLQPSPSPVLKCRLKLRKPHDPCSALRPPAIDRGDSALGANGCRMLHDGVDELLERTNGCCRGWIHSMDLSALTPQTYLTRASRRLSDLGSLFLIDRKICHFPPHNPSHVSRNIDSNHS